MDELLPVHIAKLDDEAAHALLGAVALRNGVMVLPLMDPPVEGTLHVLEIHVPGAEPLLLLAQPEGAPTDAGYPLRLSPMSAQQAEGLAVVASDVRGPSATHSPPAPSRRPTESSGSLGPAEQARDENADPLIGRSIAGGKFYIAEILGSGATGKVYRARHRELRKNIAVKVLHGFFQRDLDFCARFYGEALAASKLDHPNVLRIDDFGQEPDGMLYIAMELIEGQSLQASIDRHGPHETGRVAHLMMQVCGALTAAHEKGVIHRDIKPENIMLIAGRDDDGHATEVVKVCDFGIAQLRNQTVDGEELIDKARAQIAGTPEYMSPEQGRGEELDERSDVYACGITLYELATGHVPFTATSPTAVLMKHFFEEPVLPSLFNPNIDPLLESIILKAIHKERGQRQQTTRELRAELRELLDPAMRSRRPSAPAGATRRREILDAAALPALGESSSGFAELFIALASAVSRTGYYERGHRESGLALMRLGQAADLTLKNRGELCFARHEVGDSTELSIVSGVGEVHELKKLLPGALVSMFAQKFGEVFARRNIVGLTLEDGVDDEELGQMIELLSGPEIGATRLRAQFELRRLSHVKLLFASDLLGRERKLPWQVDLCISRLARELGRLPLLCGVDIETMRVLRMHIIADAVRALARPEQAKLLLANSDLIAAQVRHIPELSHLNVLESLVEVMPRARCIQVAELALAELGEEASASGGETLERLDTCATARRVVVVIGARFVRDRSIESDGVLRALHRGGILKLASIPADLQAWIRAEGQSETLRSDTLAVLRPMGAITDLEHFASELRTLELSMRMLAKTGAATPLWTVVKWLKRGIDSDPIRGSVAAPVLRSIEDPAVLAPIAEALLSGRVQERDSARALLVHASGPGARALYAARVVAVPEPGVRARFVATMREIGIPALPTLAAAIERVEPGSTPAFDAALAEDLLRALPPVCDEPIGALVAKFVRSGVPAVCKAAVVALVTLWGARTRPLLIGVLDYQDDGVRIAALQGLRLVHGIDETVVARIEGILTRSGTGADLRAAAAASLADALPSARPPAVELLRRSLMPPPRGLLSMLRGQTFADEEPRVVGALARAAIAIGGTDGLDMVAARAARCEEPLRTQLLDLGQG